MELNSAPILIPTLNRYTHLKKCIDSLSKCVLAEHTDLFLALDFPPAEKYEEGYKKILEFTESDVFKSFKSFNLIKRSENFGAQKNMRAARDVIFEKYDKIIISEDDNVFSPDFLEYINKGLITYKDRDDIFSVIGYHYPVSINTPSGMYMYNGFSAWGYGTWKDKWKKAVWNLNELETFLANKENLKNFNKPRLLKSLKKIVDSGIITGDTYLCYYQLKNKMYSVYPTISKVKNTGHDGSGIHGGNNERLRNIYLNQELSLGDKEIIFPKDLKPNSKIIKKVDKHLNPSYFKILLQNPSLFFKYFKNKKK